MTENILTIKDLHVSISDQFKNNPEILHGVSLSLAKGEIIGVVGESGSGKTMTMKAIMGLLPSNASASWETYTFDGIARSLNARKIDAAMIFQDSMTALDPLKTIGYHLMEVVKRTKTIENKAIKSTIISSLEQVGIQDPIAVANKYPHQLSGGMRQRVLIAMAILTQAKLLIADEPTTALDVTIQAQILRLIYKLHLEKQLSIIFITHDLGIVAQISSRVYVMRDGIVVEEGTTQEIFQDARHSYTKMLLNASKMIIENNSKIFSQSLNKNQLPQKMTNISETHFVREES